MSKPLGETEKTVLVGGLIVAFWLGIDALVTRAEKRDKGTADGESRMRRTGRDSTRFGRRARKASEAA